jgi:uncharacterized protein (DUF1800 family)
MTLCRRTLLTAACALPLAQSARAATVAPDALAAHALNRLAWGPRPGDLARVQAMGWRAYLAEQLQPERLPQPELDARLAALHSKPLREAVGAYRESQRRDPSEGNTERREQVREAMAQAVQTWLLPALDSPRQLHAVMTDFWFHHFNVFIGKGFCRVMVGDYVYRAIAPNAMGRFRELLGATAQHPAMLFYLDNWLSSGREASGGRFDAERRTAPVSRERAGEMVAVPPSRSRGGLNENYARELMELHTLGVDGGYTQADVTELARVFTGWTLNVGRGGRRNTAGDGDALFAFDPRRHDDGAKTWLGQRVPGRGQQQGEWALDQLARHPSTARHIAFKLARHFVSDEPDAALAQHVAAAFTRSDGDVRSTLEALFTHPAFTAPQAVGAKFKTPQRFVISLLRASGQSGSPEWVEPVLQGLRALGQAPFAWPTPDGPKPTRAAWLDPEALARRADLAGRFAQRAQLGGSAVPGLLDTLGPTIGARTRSAIAAEAPRLQAALLLASPDFQDT